jgi:hypothetical protein
MYLRSFKSQEKLESANRKSTNYKSAHHKKNESANNKFADDHIGARSRNLTQICGFVICGTYLLTHCAAKAFCYCPAIISHRPRSQNILKERALNPEKDSRIKRPRSQVSLEKSSQNY